MIRLAHLIESLLRAKKESGRPLVALLYEIVRLRFSIGRIGITEYLDFRFHLNDIAFADKRAFGGWRAQVVLEEILIDDYARFLSLDKITMHILMSGYGLPVPMLRAAYRSRRPSSLQTLESPAALAEFLTAAGVLPIYLKPSLGSYGRGNALLQRIDGEMLVLGDETRIPISTFCESLDEGRGLGWILQEPLIPHPAIAAVCGSKISGVRIHSFLSLAGPVLTKAVWKINIGREDSDNFRHGASGNLLAALDMETGKVTRVVAGTGLEQTVNPLHPVSRMPLVGFQIPYWDELKSLVCDAQLAFPGFLCPGWDIAICPDGPKILEVNFFGDIDLTQHAHRRGFLDAEFLGLMNDRGIGELLCDPAKELNQLKTNNRRGPRRQHWNW